jgi:hypothetical protein
MAECEISFGGNMSADMVLTNMVFDDGGWLVVV